MQKLLLRLSTLLVFLALTLPVSSEKISSLVNDVSTSVVTIGNKGCITSLASNLFCSNLTIKSNPLQAMQFAVFINRQSNIYLEKVITTGIDNFVFIVRSKESKGDVAAINE